MNIALIGYGKVGKFIEELSVNYSNITISKRFDPIIFNNKLNKEELENIDVCIDFSTPNSVLQNAKIVASAKKNLIIGTTGWEENFEIIKNLTLENEIGIVYGSNFSVGMNLFFKLLQYFSSLMNKVASYDVYGYESHHNQKLDSPSGTAKTLTNIILENIDRKKIPQFEKLENKIKPEELHFASIRAGSIFGNHTIGFDSEFDEITLTHSAKNRKGFALGALNAAIFIHQKKGFFEFEEIFDQILNQQQIMKINFTKIQAQGNDYIYFDFTQIEKPNLDYSAIAKDISRRNFSIGSDGLVLINKSSEADAFMDIYNADGSRAKMCGSALRSVVYYLHCNDKNYKQEFEINTLSGIKFGQILNDKSIKVNMGQANILKENLTIDNFTGNYISVGNPHFVILSDDISYENTNLYGSKIEKNSCYYLFFENGVNVEFAQIIDKNNIKMFVWERGSQQTYACGTGACAVFFQCLQTKISRKRS